MAGVRAWADRHLNLNGYALTAPNATGLQLYSPSELSVLSNGNVVLMTRMEAYAAQGTDGAAFRSGRFETEFDCRTPRNRVVGMDLYEHLNLEGRSQRFEQGTAWMSFDGNPDGARLREQLCAQRELVREGADLALALPPNPKSSDDEDVADWLLQYIDPRDDIYAGHTDRAAGLYSIVEGERTRQDYIRLWTRLESFDPEVDDGVLTRSMRALQEFDCAEGRVRTLALEVYPGANLTGSKRAYTPGEAAWTFIKPQTMESVFGTAVCDLKDEADAEVEDSITRPRLPSRDAKTDL